MNPTQAAHRAPSSAQETNEEDVQVPAEENPTEGPVISQVCSLLVVKVIHTVNLLILILVM